MNILLFLLLVWASAPQSRPVAAVLAEALERAYVDEAVGRTLAAELRRRAASGEFDGLGGDDLAKTLNAALRSVTSDPHLGIRYNPNGTVDTGKAKPSAEDAERFRRSAAAQNFGFEKVERLAGNVGFLELNGFIDARLGGETAVAAMGFLAHTDAVVIDLRYNSGGSPGIGLLLSSYFFEKPVHLHSIDWRNADGRRVDQYWTMPFVPGQKLTRQPLFILTSNRTISAAESFTYSLQAIGRARVVGEVSAGGGHAGAEVPIGPDFLAFIPTGRAVNPTTKTNWEGTGIQPDVVVDESEALRTAHRLALQSLRDASTDAGTRAKYESILKELFPSP
jgi:C-terminal processing protease CtpA/Prc